MKVYVLSYEDLNDDFYSNYIKVYSKKELAQKQVEIILEDLKRDIYNVEDMVLDYLENGNGFEMYEFGRYNQNHIFARIEEKEVIDNE